MKIIAIIVIIRTTVKNNNDNSNNSKPREISQKRTLPHSYYKIRIYANCCNMKPSGCNHWTVTKLKFHIKFFKNICEDY